VVKGLNNFYEMPHRRGFYGEKFNVTLECVSNGQRDARCCVYSTLVGIQKRQQVSPGGANVLTKVCIVP